MPDPCFPGYEHYFLEQSDGAVVCQVCGAVKPPGGAEFRRQMARALSARKKTARNQRGRRPAPQITGYRINPGRQQP